MKVGNNLFKGNNMINYIKTKLKVMQMNREAKKSRKLYETRAYDYTHIATRNDVLHRINMENVRRTYRKQRQTSLSANVFFDDNNDAYVIVNKIRYNLAYAIDKAGTPLARFILDDGDVVIKPLREYIRSDEECVVIALAKTPVVNKKIDHCSRYDNYIDRSSNLNRNFI